MFEVKPLPFAKDALEPYMSQETLDYHYGKHYKTYVETLNRLIAGTEFENLSLEEIIQKTYQKPEYQAIFNNAAQAWNHEFFWSVLSPGGGGEPKGKLGARISKQFGSYEKFCETFKQAAVSQFGSGWAWVIDNGDKLEIVKTANADTPIARGQKPIMTVDVWEHAYYLDFQNRRADFVSSFLDNLAKWPNE